MAVVIVESPAIETINRYLGNKYTVLASYGHVKDLNDKEGQLTLKITFNEMANKS